MTRVGGLAPSQWVFGKFPRRGAGDQFDDEGWANYGSVQARVDGGTAFADRSEYRHSAKKAFVEVDSGRRVAKTLLSKAAPLIGNYKVGDIASFQKEKNAKNEDDRWQRGARVVGFDGAKTAWCIVDGNPACVSTERMRPCNASEALTYY